MTDYSPQLAYAKLADEALGSARQAVDTYFRGEDKAKRSVRMDMEELRSVLRSLDALGSVMETHRIEVACGKKMEGTNP